MKNVHDDLQVIEDDPLARWKAIDRSGAGVMIFLQFRFHLSSNRLQMRLGSPRTNNKEISECGNSAQIEDRNVLRFFVRGEFGADAR